MNNKAHSATKVSPFIANYGRELSVKIAEDGLNFLFLFSILFLFYFLFLIYFLFLELGLGLSDEDHAVT